MRKSRFSEEQIIGFLKEVAAGAKIDEVCRKAGVHPATYFAWKKKFGGMEVGDAKRLHSLEDENRRLKQMVADLSLEKEALKTILSKKW